MCQNANVQLLFYKRFLKIRNMTYKMRIDHKKHHYTFNPIKYKSILLMLKIMKTKPITKCVIAEKEKVNHS